MKFLPLLVAPLALGQVPCEKLVADWVGVHADMHDGDEKSLSIKKHTLHITPHGNNQTWEVEAKVDSDICTASVDFNVPGKDDHPPVPLQALFLHMNAHSGRRRGGVTKMAVGFSDPSGTLKKKGYPLNHWAVVGKTRREDSHLCPSKLDAVFADMHDGDEKRVKLSEGKLQITPNNKKEEWVVHAMFDSARCEAVIDFNVPHKPSPAPVNLTATLWQATVLNRYETREAKFKTVFEFTDPSETLAEVGYPLNHWVELKDGFDPYVPPVATGKCCYGFPGSDNWKGCQSATACPSNPSCETQGRCEGECRGSWCNDGADDVLV